MMVAAALTILLGALAPAMGATYYVSSAGSDAADGKSPQSAWQTLDRVNAAALTPGDAVLFRRGDTWRGSLNPRSGDETGCITYGAYGDGPKPMLMGSIARSRPEDWRQEGERLWVTGGLGEVTVPQAEPEPPERAMPWGIYAEGGAAISLHSGDRESPDALRVDCAQPGTAMHHIQIITMGLGIREGKAYRLVFRAKATQPFRLRMPQLMQADAPWSGYSSGPALRTYVLGTDWQTLLQHYVANTDSANARLTFYLGGAMPAGASLLLDRISFSECPLSEIPAPSILPVDVGNIIFGDEASCGVKVFRREDLKAQGQFWYDQDRQALVVYSEDNPATRYGSVECALHRHIINQSGKHHIIYQDLALKYGGAHGIGGGSTHHITVRRCDLSYIGGANQFGGDRTVRFGNGIEFWGAAHDNLVERCRLWEIYDAALTNQNMGAVVEEANITYRYNVIWNCEYSFEYWNLPEQSVTRNIRFENNSCLNAGHGWGHSQRPDPSGRHLCFYSSPAQAEGIIIRNNIFYEAKTNAFYAPGWKPEAVRALRMDHNLWYQGEGAMIAVAGKQYTWHQFADYQAEWGLEPHSLVGSPEWVAPQAGNLALKANSPCVDAGVDTGATEDFLGSPVPKGKAPDIGAVETW